jgi:Glycosyl transferase family 2
MPPLQRIRSVLGARLHLLQARYEAATRLGEVREDMAALQRDVTELRGAVDHLQALQTKQLQLARAEHDDIAGVRDKLVKLRRSEAYASVFANQTPLISVPIATYNHAELLVERAIASVQAQTYDRWEIVVVGDGCTDDTAERIEAIGDPRIVFVNLPHRTVYPDTERERWMVAGSTPWNRAVELCSGEWIAALDDDDEMLPHHMETLLELALRTRAEFVYGALEKVGAPEDERHLFHFPAKFAFTAMQAAIYLRGLSFVECDIHSWAVDEPIDWNLIRRMRDAGVLMAATDVTVTRYYPSMGTRT